MSVRDFGHFDAPPRSFWRGLLEYAGAGGSGYAVRGASEVSTGGHVGYAAEPMQTVALFHDLGWTGIAGTCERDSAEEAADRNFGGAGGSPRDMLSGGRYPCAWAAVAAED